MGVGSVHFTDGMLELLMVCSSYPQLVARVVLDCFRDVREGLTELPHYIAKVVVHIDFDVDVGEGVHL